MARVTTKAMARGLTKASFFREFSKVLSAEEDSEENKEKVAI